MRCERQARGLIMLALLGATLVAGCGGGSNLPEITGSASLPSVSRTASVPSATGTESVPSESEPSDEDTRTASERPSKSPIRSDSESPTLTESTTPSATPTTSATSAANDSESSDSAWWPWLLLALVVIGGIVWFLVAAARHRKWDAAFALALTEARWEADSLAPSLLDPSISGDVLAERWRGNQRRLDDMQTELTRLAGTAAGTQRSARIARVSGAAAALRQALASDVALRSGTSMPTASDLAQSGRMAQNRSDALLAAVDDRPDPAEPPVTGADPPGKHER